jgi:hypothetical protein
MSELIKVNKKDFVTKFEPVRMITEFRHVKTIGQAIKEDQNGLSFYSKELGLDTVLAVIELHLIALNQSVNVNLPLSKNQIKEIAIEIVSEFYYLSMVEVAFIFRKAKRGEFGKLFGALNIVDILTWFRTYSEERSDHFVNKQLDNRSADHSMRSEDRELWRRNERLINNNKDQGIK